jgi:hypothetical protein
MLMVGGAGALWREQFEEIIVVRLPFFWVLLLFIHRNGNPIA